jgi:mono/diheme cytochrome c family protein
MYRSAISAGRPSSRRRRATPARAKCWPYALLPLGTAALLISSAAFGFGSGATAVHAKKRAAQPHPAASPAKSATESPRLSAAAQGFLRQTCLGCHGKAASGGLNLTATAFKPTEAKNFDFWVKLHDRVAKGEMPPKGASQPTPAARKSFLAALAQPLVAIDDAKARLYGRATLRRMNRYEYENTLRDLLDAPWLEIKDMLPEDGLAYRFNKVGDALDVSYVQMGRYLAAADYALREVAAKQIARPETITRRYYARDQRSFAGLAKFSVFNGSPERATFPIIGDKADLAALDDKGPITVGAKDPARREIEGMGVVASAYEPLQPKFNQFRAPVSGRYKLRLCAHSFWAGPESPKHWWRPSRTDISAGRTQEPISLYAAFAPQRLRKLGSIDVGPKSTVGEMDVYLLKGETIQPDAVRFFRSRPPGWHNPLAEKDGQPGVCFQWLEATGPIFDAWPTPGQRLLFGDLPLKDDGAGRPEVVSADPDADASRLLHAFMKRALRHPVREQEVQPFVKLARTTRAGGASFSDAMIAAYSGVLCSPGFITLEEKPGPLDDHALAERLSYFLWNSEPDAALRAAADRGALHTPAVLAAQTDRMLADPRSQRFVDAFLDYWLDLRKTDNTSPDEVLYPDYYLDDYLVESSIDETRAFFHALVKDDMPARNLVSSDFVMVNDRLAALYGLPGVQGAAIRRVELPKDSVRGGLLTQASVLKVTANGTTTSPVLRGVWITERILGQTVPPPPPSVRAIEPDTRGATTIREQLAKHRTDPTCSSCHRIIDPPGFALESFDVFGGYRNCYRALSDGHTQAAPEPGFGKNGQAFVFHAAQKVDPSGVLLDGRRFDDVRGLKRLLLQDERQIARNLVQQLVVYSTGAPVRFGDRPKVEAILDRAKASGYGVKSLIHGIVDSELFRNK